jgi:hypothetical protein
MGHSHDGHTHGAGVRLESAAHGILVRGIRELIEMTRGMEFQPVVSERYPNPLATMAYPRVPDPEQVVSEITARLEEAPVSVLERALVLLELYECNQPGSEEFILDDKSQLDHVFSSKRCNGWISIIGDTDHEKLEAAINAQWQFRFIPGRTRRTNVYALLNRLTRYAYTYGRIPFGDGHRLSHFVEDHTPGLIICSGAMDDLELTLSLAAMKMGVPAIVPTDYPFPLGTHARTDDPAAMQEAVVAFPNIRRLLDMPEIPKLPSYCDPANREEKFVAATRWGDTPESFYLLQKGAVDETGWTIDGTPGKSRAMGILIVVDAEPMDAFDCKFFERGTRGAYQALNQLKGVRAILAPGALMLEIAAGVELDPDRVGETLVAELRRERPILDKIRVEIIFNRKRLEKMAPDIRARIEARDREIAQTTEETAANFSACVGCSPFAPDHVCILTPERPPQCGQSYERFKTGALYSYDEMSNIHHSWLHRGINSFQVVEKGECLDPVRGEWSGVNEAVTRLSKGRTTRIQLHCIDDFPTTGCGCFGFIAFKLNAPGTGIGLMDAGYEGQCPDGRSWLDLKYALGGKQCPGMAGFGAGYLRSPKFIQAHGGWDAVVWVSPKIAAIMGEDLPQGMVIGD